MAQYRRFFNTLNFVISKFPIRMESIKSNVICVYSLKLLRYLPRVEGYTPQLAATGTKPPNPLFYISAYTYFLHSCNVLVDIMVETQKSSRLLFQYIK